MSILPPFSIVTLLRYVSIELKELLTYLLSFADDIGLLKQWTSSCSTMQIMVSLFLYVVASISFVLVTTGYV